jgi:hypothetical protein
MEIINVLSKFMFIIDLLTHSALKLQFNRKVIHIRYATAYIDQNSECSWNCYVNKLSFVLGRLKYIFMQLIH